MTRPTIIRFGHDVENLGRQTIYFHLVRPTGSRSPARTHIDQAALNQVAQNMASRPGIPRSEAAMGRYPPGILVDESPVVTSRSTSRLRPRRSPAFIVLQIACSFPSGKSWIARLMPWKKTRRVLGDSYWISAWYLVATNLTRGAVGAQQ